MNQSARCRIISALLVVLNFALNPLSSSLLADDIDAAAAKIAEREKQFDREFFRDQPDSSIEARQTRLQRILKRRIDALDRQLGLSESQKKKLELAGSSSIKKVVETIDVQRKLFASVERDQKQQFQFMNEDPGMIALRKEMRTGPFGDDSLFQKMLLSTLTAEQTAKQVQVLEQATSSKRPIDLKSVADLVRISQFQMDVYRIAWNPVSSEVALVQFSRPVELFTLPLEKPLRTLLHVKPAVGCELSPDGQCIAISENSNSVHLVKLADESEIVIDSGQSQPAVCFSPDGKMLVTGGYGTSVKIWSASSGGLIRDIKLGTIEGAMTPVFSPDGKTLAVGNRNSTTALIDPTNGTIRKNLSKSMSQQLRFDPSGKTIAVTYVDGSLTLWDAATGKVRKDTQASAYQLFTVNWSPDGSLLVTGGHHSPLTLWRSYDLKIVNELESGERVMDARFNRDGTRLLVANKNRNPIECLVETWAVP